MTSKLILAITTATVLLTSHAHALQSTNCNNAITPTTPDSRFTIHNDGTVTDTKTGLMWQRCSLGQTWDSTNTTCSTDTSNHNWQQALAAAEASTFAGYNDWKLPNQKELSSIVEYACSEPAINTDIFPATPSSWFWSSSPKADENSYALVVDFVYGGGNYNRKDGLVLVRFVRPGQ
ncbi:DUF1566 domain-containing protein [Chrysiogenes arsenatis]|uniref:Lcl C-terminal domain-containing protein n=1 Tax=Chrysiogenes arsenatis TaxID=309797 RepID=UPI0004241B69|nr:DUF1566 domain-containing protein [Chrysiogenes arsenatis]